MSIADISSSNNVHVPSDDGTIDDSNAKSQNSGVEVVNGDNHGDVVSNADDGINTGDGDDRTGDSKVGDEPANEDIQGSSDEADDETYADGKNNQPANEDTVEEDNTEKADIEIQDVDTEEKTLGRQSGLECSKAISSNGHMTASVEAAESTKTTNNEDKK